MSKDVMIQLGIVPEAFPAIGGARQGKTSESEHASLNFDVDQEECPCIPRTPPPGRPKNLPMEATDKKYQTTYSH